jgi:hypothetical protein
MQRWEDLDHRSTAVARGPFFLNPYSDSDFKHEAGFQYRGDILCLGRGSGARDLFICYLDTHLSMIAKLETAGAGMNCIRLQLPSRFE